MMPKKEEEQSMGTLDLLRRRNKIPTEGDTETKYGAESEGETIQRLPHLGIHPIYNYKTQTIVSGFCNCIWDGYLGGAVSGLSFRLCSTLCPCISFCGYFVPPSKKDQSIHTLFFLLLGHHLVCEIYLIKKICTVKTRYTVIFHG